MESKDKELRRYTLFLPINENTEKNIYDIIGYVSDVVGGCTYTRFHIPAINIEDEEILGYLIGKFDNYPNEEVVCLVTDVNIFNNIELHDRLKVLISKIEQMGEEVVWLTYHDIMLCQ